MTSGRPLLLMSGGLDSTYLAYLLASSGKSFDVIYVNGGQDGNKFQAEEKARQLIIDYLMEHYKVSINTLPTLSQVRFVNSPQVAFTQLMPWFVNAMEAVHPEHHSCVQMGYVVGDQMASFAYRIINAWNELWRVCKRTAEIVPLQMPLLDEGKTKFKILTELPEELYKLTWVCELPRYESRHNPHLGEILVPCDECQTCITRKVEAYRYHLTTGKTLPLDNWMQAKVDNKTTNPTITPGVSGYTD